MSPVSAPALTWAIVLTGGQGRRLGNVAKDQIILDGKSLLHRTLAAIPATAQLVVVGPRSQEHMVKQPISYTREDPPGGGPAAGLAAGVHYLELQQMPGTWGVVLAVDQPGVTTATIERLQQAAYSSGRSAVLVSRHQRQYTIAVFRSDDLATAAARRPTWHGKSLKSLLSEVELQEVPALNQETRDIDTPADLDWWQSTVT